MKLALILFILTYVFLFIFSNHKHIVSLISALIFVILGILPVNKIFSSIDFNVLMMILGIMGIVNLFIDSKMPNKLSDMIIDKSPNVKWMTVYLALFSAVVSAFVDNVATVLMIAPVALSVSKKLKISPVPILISISIFSNLEGAATLVGDTTSILLAGHANMNFLDFFIYNGKVGLFFIIQLGTVLSLSVLFHKLRKEKKEIHKEGETKVDDLFPTYMLGLTLLTLIIISFFSNKPALSNGIVCMVFYIIGLIRDIIKDKNFTALKDQLMIIDYQTLLLLASLFVIIGGINEAGVINAISKLFEGISTNTFVLYTCLVFFSVIISAFIDNIPYVATMLPVVSSLSVSLGIEPTVLFYGLIIGATLGGNLTPVGASANITSIGILNKNGYSISLKEYLSYSVPITLIAVLTGYLLVLFEYLV